MSYYFCYYYSSHVFEIYQRKPDMILKRPVNGSLLVVFTMLHIYNYIKIT